MPHREFPTPRLVDATLREGFQAPNTHFSLTDVMEIARHLATVGTDMLEVGHPYVSPDAMRHVRAVVGLKLGLPVLSHARANPADIHAVAESGADWVGIFVGVNAISQTARLNGRSFDAILDLITSGVSLARSLDLKVRFTVEDASRTEHDRLRAVYGAAVAAGADRICYADSVGVSEPGQVTAVFRALAQAFPGTELEGHFHNDRSLATANALAALDGGADWISVAVNGLGERCGITDHGVLAANLAYRGSRPLSHAQGQAFSALTARVARQSGQSIPKFHPVFGDYAFTHTARLHVLAVVRDRKSYEWISPDLFGRQHEVMPLRTAEAPAHPLPNTRYARAGD